MEYVDGYDLAQLVKGQGPLPVAHACNFVYQAAQGLQYAHEKGMVHRDIKPSNLMLSRHAKRAVIKILDFGLAKATREGPVDRSLTHEGQMLGTPDYMAPEQISDARRADTRADIYSLGCTLYYLLTGAPPFRATNLYDILQAHHSMDALPLNLARSDVPVELAALVARMMAKEPERRFQTPRDVAQALAPFFKSGGAAVGPASVQLSALGIAGSHAETARALVVPPLPSAAGAQPAAARREAVDLTSPAAQLPGIITAAEQTPLDVKAPAGVPASRRWPAHRRPITIGAIAIGLTLVGTFMYLATNRGSSRTAATVTKRETIDASQSKTNANTVAIPPRSAESPADSSPRYEKRASDPSQVVAADQNYPPAISIGDGHWWIDGRQLVQDAKARQKAGNVLFFGSPDWTDYDFTCEAKLVSGSDGVGICFRANRSLGAFVFAAGSYQSVWHLLFRLDDGASTSDLKRVRGVLDLDHWYKVRVTVRGSHFQCFLDEKLIFDVTDDLNPRGRVGLRTMSSVARFRNIRVVDPDNKLLWDGLPELPASSDRSATIPITEVALDGFNQSMRTRETNLGDLVADSLRWYVNQPELGIPSADIAMLNGAGVQIDGVIPKGPILEEMIRQVASWDDHVAVVVNVSSAKIKELLEDAISRSPAFDNGFLQIAGLKVTYDLSGTPQTRDNRWAITKPGKRVREAMLGSGTPLITRGVVAAGAPSVNVATTDYMARSYQTFQGCSYTRLDATYQQALRDFIKSTRGLGGTVRGADYPEGGSGRIKITKPNEPPR